MDKEKTVTPSSIAKQKAAQAWCGEKTSGIEMDVELATEFAKIIDEYIEALRWCSGSSDFAPGGNARVGWEMVVMRLIS